jgi:hypothetical protein
MTRQNYPSLYADIQFNTDNGAVTNTVDLRVGGTYLKGTGSGTLVNNGDGGSRLENPSLTLENQDGVRFDFSNSASTIGTVKAGTPLTQVATITTFGDLLRVNYTDGTFDAF